jgi:hypothetical protein
MTTQITIADLVDSLRKASSNPQAHQPAQLTYFSDLKDNSVLTHCGTACCVAGDLLLRAHADYSEEELKALVDNYPINTCTLVSDVLKLNRVEATLAFDSRTHYRVHELLADLLDAGLRLYSPYEVIMYHGNTYTCFHRAYINAGYYKEVSLEGLLEWMWTIAQ